MQSSFFANFMCFDVPTLAPSSDGTDYDDDGADANDDDLGIMDIDENDNKSGTCNSAL